jgi:spermidine/putrescine transport system substrate-binding protein
MRHKPSRQAISRRQVLRAGAGAGIALASFAIPRASLGQDKMTKELVISTWSGFFSEAVKQSLVEPFQKEFGVQVRVGVTSNAGELMTRIRAGAMGGGGDVIDLFWNEYPTAYTAIKQGWVEPLRVENIPNFASVLPSLNKTLRPVPWDPAPGVNAAPAQMVSRGIAYDPRKINRKLDSLSELWNPELGRRIAIFNNTSWMVGNGAFRTGQDPNAIADIEKVWEALREQRKVVGRYFNNLVEGQELFKNETAWIAPLNGGRVLDLRSQGIPLEYYKPKEGWMLNADVLQVGKGSPNRLTAEKFIDFYYRSDIVTRASELMNFPIASRNLQATDKIKSLPDYDPSGELQGARFYDPTYWDTNTSKWAEKVREIVAG